jgi:hypothetical protein
MDQRVRAKLEEAGWVEDRDYPGAFVRRPELRERARIDWMAEPADLELPTVDATNLKK